MDSGGPIQWTDNVYPLKKYRQIAATKLGGNGINDVDMPSIVRVVPNSEVRLPSRLAEAEALLLYSVQSHRKIVCQCVASFDPVTRATTFAPHRFSVPLSYQGWFEVLNEEGTAVSPMTRVCDLAEGRVEQFLVRSICKVFACKHPAGVGGGAEPNFDKTRLTSGDEVMTVVGRITAIMGWKKKRVQLLHCTDEQGEDVYLDYRTTGIFSAVAGPNNISGVHKMNRVVSNFRFPLTVRVVAGKIPRTSVQGALPGVFRLLDLQKDSMAFFLPLQCGEGGELAPSSSSRLVPLSTRTPVVLRRAVGSSALVGHRDFRPVLSLCLEKTTRYFETIQMLVSTTEESGLDASGVTGDNSYETFPPRQRRRSTRKRKDTDSRAVSAPAVQRTEEDVLFEEVDDLYDYVRRGGEPPKPRPRSWAPMAGASLSINGGESTAFDQSLVAELAGGSSHKYQSQPDLRKLHALTPVAIDDSEYNTKGKLVVLSQEHERLVGNNGVERGQLAVLTKGRFQRKRSTTTSTSTTPVTTPVSALPPILKHASSTPSVHTMSMSMDVRDAMASYTPMHRRRSRYYENVDFNGESLSDAHHTQDQPKSQRTSAKQQQQQPQRRYSDDAILTKQQPSADGETRERVQECISPPPGTQRESSPPLHHAPIHRHEVLGGGGHYSLGRDGASSLSPLQRGSKHSDKEMVVVLPKSQRNKSQSDGVTSELAKPERKILLMSNKDSSYDTCSVARDRRQSARSRLPADGESLSPSPLPDYINCSFSPIEPSRETITLSRDTLPYRSVVTGYHHHQPTSPQNYDTRRLKESKEPRSPQRNNASASLNRNYLSPTLPLSRVPDSLSEESGRGTMDSDTANTNSSNLAKDISHSTGDLVKLFENMKPRDAISGGSAAKFTALMSPKPPKHRGDCHRATPDILSFATTPSSSPIIPSSYSTYSPCKAGKYSAANVEYNSFVSDKGKEFSPKRLSTAIQQRIMLFQGINA